MLNPMKTRTLVVVAVAIFFVLPVASAFADTLGDSHSFNVNEEYDMYKRTSLTATLRYVGEHAYYYIDDRYWNETLSIAEREAAMTQIEKLSDEFDKIIYPKETAIWGSEPNPGVDQDPRLTILLEYVVDGNGGYFESINAYRKDQAPESNQREMLTVSARTLSSDILKSFLAHEFQHLISFQQKELSMHSSEETWLNELRSEYAPTLLGYSEPYEQSSLARRVDLFLQDPTDSLTEWPNTTKDYATATVFGHYLVGRYGLGILSETLKMSLNGIRSLEQYLVDKGTPEHFYKIFEDWMAASYINDMKAGSAYRYNNQELTGIRVQPTNRSPVYGSNPTSTTYLIKGWQPVWHEFNLYQPLEATQGLKFEFSAGIGDQFPLAVMLFYDDGSIAVSTGEPLGGSTVIYATNSSDGSGATSKKITKVVLAMSYISSEQVDGPYAAHSLTSSVSYVPVSEVELALQTTGQNIREVGGRRVADGALVKRDNAEPEMYVVQGKYKRYLRPEIIKLYGHLNPAEVISMIGQTFDSYITANYVRGVNDKKVYAVWPDGTKHWLNITSQQWDASGRDWNAIFIINDRELAAYRTGIDITR